MFDLPHATGKKMKELNLNLRIFDYGTLGHGPGHSYQKHLPTYFFLNCILG